MIFIRNVFTGFAFTLGIDFLKLVWRNSLYGIIKKTLFAS